MRRLTLVLFFLPSIAFVFGASAAPPAGAPSGVRFRIAAAIEPRPPNASITGGSLDVTLRISAHAVGSNFYGEVTRRFSDFTAGQGAAERTYWEDGACHQRRGFPKVTVLSIGGTATRDGKTRSIQALRRHIGLLLPEDEVLGGAGLTITKRPTGRLIEFRAHTRESGLIVSVRIYETPCTLGPSVSRASQ